jgi:hypothetical protein
MRLEATRSGRGWMMAEQPEAKVVNVFLSTGDLETP